MTSREIGLLNREPYLSGHRALKDQEHAEDEERVIPVLVEHPEDTAEDLEHEEGRRHLLHVQLPEARHLCQVKKHEQKHFRDIDIFSEKRREHKLCNRGPRT